MNGAILYIEDNDNNFYLVNFILQSKDFKLIRARDGKEGIEIATGTKFDLILLDIQLPIMDGYAVARALRTNQSLDQVPIVALTSYAVTGDREKAFESGCTEYIEKPINPQSFLKQIEYYINRH